MVLRPYADAEILLWATGTSARASSPRSVLSPTVVDRPVVVDILCGLEDRMGV